MTSNKQKAQQLVSEAEKMLSSAKGFLRSLFGSSNKAFDASDCYERAGNLYKMDKNWNSAGQAFLSAANLLADDDSRHNAASNYVEAANCFRKNDVNQAVDALILAIDIYTDMGRFAIAAKHHRTIAELYENTGSVDKAVQHYEKAADYYSSEESTGAVNKCLLKVAQYAAQLENYDKAINIYKEAAVSALQSSLLKYSAKEYMFRAVLCQLTVDMLNAQHVLGIFVEMNPAFQDSREYKFLQQLIEHMDDSNVEAFTDAVKNYDKISCLDQWYTMMLLRIKKQINLIPDLR